MIRAFTASERPDLIDRVDFNVWPTYNTKGDVTTALWPRLYSDFPDFQFVLYDGEADELVAEGHTVPLAWDGTAEGLPAGIDGAIEGAMRLHDEGGRATTLCAMAAEVRPERQGRGLAGRMIEEMAKIGRAHGFSDLIAPVRPSWKERYPLTSIDEYVRWTREDGLPFDPWIRVHVRLGGEILRPEPRSMRISGTVAEWEEWVDLALPASGDYVFPQGLTTLHVDRENDAGVYYEPNVWMRHRLE
jgi:GNAT superfamily N-acetyltransferase